MCRRGKGGHETLEGQNHTHGELSRHRQPYAQRQHDDIRQRGHEGRRHAQVLIQLGILDLLGVHAGLIAGPFLEIAVFRAAGLDGFDHFNAGDRRACQLARVAHLDAGEVGALPGDDPGHEHIDCNGGQAHDGQRQAVTDHDDEVEDHHDRLQHEGREGVHQRFCNVGVGVLALHDIARHALGEELHWHPQHLPHIAGAAHSGQLAVDAQGVHRLNPCHDDLHHGQCRKSDDERREPFGIDSGQQPIQKYAGKSRLNHADERGNDRRKDHEGNRRASAMQALPGEGQHALGLAAGFKVLARLKHQTDTGEGLVELLHGNGTAAPGRVIQNSLAALEAAKHHKMIEIPVDNAGERSLFLERIRLIPITLGCQAIAAGSPKHVFRIGAVPGNAAVGANLLQRNPFFIIRQDHCQRGRTAFEGLHLHDHRHFDHAAGCGLPDLFLFRFHAAPQLKMKDMGVMLSTTISAP